MLTVLWTEVSNQADQLELLVWLQKRDIVLPHIGQVLFAERSLCLQSRDKDMPTVLC